MLAPNAEQIETAVDQMKDVSQFIHDAQQKELHFAIGDGRRVALGISGLSNDFMTGYALGLQTARVVISQNTALVVSDVDSKGVL